MTTPTFARPALVALALLSAATAAQAASLSIVVTGADGKPAADTVVMVRRGSGFQTFDLREVPVVTQKDVRFSLYVTVVPPRATVRFVNQDRFDHHVRSMPTGPMSNVPPAQDFEFRLAAARGKTVTSADLKLETSGAIVIGCHLHGSMRAHIFVSPTPHFAVTDEQGRASLEVPDGPGTLALWHPDQFAEQPAMSLQVAGNGTLNQVLNFSPRKRPPPRTTPKGEYEQ